MSQLTNTPLVKYLLYSLRGQYLVVTVITAMALIISSLATQSYISDSSQNATEDIKNRLQLLNETRLVRDKIWDAHFFLQTHSLAPTKENRYFVKSKLHNAIAHLTHIQNMAWISTEHKLLNTELIQSLQQLDKDSQDMMAIRIMPDELFPAIQISRASMLQIQTSFSDHINLSLDESLSELDNYNRQHILLFNELRYQWAQMISTYRMFLINKLASVSTDKLGPQINNIDLYFQTIKDYLLRLSQLKKANQLGFQSTESIPILTATAEAWYRHFEKIKELDTPEEWRVDYPVLTNNIAPTLKIIWGKLQAFDTQIEKYAHDDAIKLFNVADEIKLLLWSISLVGLFLLVMGYYLFHRTVLKPLDLITSAMKHDAININHQEPLSINARSLETRNLLDAFALMRRHVHTRQNALEHQTLHDSLTQLPNRLLLFDRLKHSINANKRHYNPITLLMMDLNRFKEINDTLGHHAGDNLLQTVSRRLLKTLREADTVARLGGDEFAILIPDCDIHQAKVIVKKIMSAIDKAVQLNEQSIYIHASIGIALYPQHADNAETLLKRADVAMYTAKRNNTGFEIYQPQQDRHSLDKLTLKTELQKALLNNQLLLHYQPQIDIKTGNIIGAEALLRWPHPTEGAITPDVFIPLAEETGIIKQVTEWIIEQALWQQQQWQQQDIHLHVSINLSAWNLLDPEINALIFERVKQSSIPPSKLSFEITESAMMTDTDRALEVMNNISKAGFKLIIDDYGTGFSSLAYMKLFPVSELKIDKSFVMHMTENDNDAVIVRSTIDLAHNLGLQVVAEGVENQEVLHTLEILGCDMAQGYHIARPLPADELVVWLHEYLQEHQAIID